VTGNSFTGIFKVVKMEILKSFGERVAFHKQRSHRIEALSDGVFAITMTLLVLDIRIPLGRMTTEVNLWLALMHTVPKILTYVLSFSLAGQFWAVFMNQFNYIHASDRNGNIIAVFYFLFVSLLPFSTSFLSEHLWSKVAVGFYVFNIFFIVLLATLHWMYSYYAGLVQVEGNDRNVIHKAIMRLARTALVSYGVVACCCIFSSYLALCATICLQIAFTFIGFIEILLSTWKKKLKIFTVSVQNRDV
jgi:uncharacterized membrane protein